MKKNINFVYPAIFVKDANDDSYQVLFPDLNIYTDGLNITEAYIRARELLKVYFSYAMKYETDFNLPSKMDKLLEKLNKNETVMLIDAEVDVEV